MILGLWYRLALSLCLALVALTGRAAFADDHADDETSGETSTWDEASEAVFCVPRCTSRTLNGTCWRYGSDFCTPFPETACIPHCDDRTTTGRCTGYGVDFCGVMPECAPHCTERTNSGRCIRYGPDVCVG